MNVSYRMRKELKILNGKTKECESEWEMRWEENRKFQGKQKKYFRVKWKKAFFFLPFLQNEEGNPWEVRIMRRTEGEEEEGDEEQEGEQELKAIKRMKQNWQDLIDISKTEILLSFSLKNERKTHNFWNNSEIILLTEWDGREGISHSVGVNCLGDVWSVRGPETPI